jgi:hypothetical protein
MVHPVLSEPAHPETHLTRNAHQVSSDRGVVLTSHQSKGEIQRMEISLDRTTLLSNPGTGKHFSQPQSVQTASGAHHPPIQ